MKAKKWLTKDGKDYIIAFVPNEASFQCKQAAVVE